MKTLMEVINLSTQYLAQKGIDRAKRQAEELIADVLNLKRIDLYLQFDRPLIEEELKQCREVLIRKGKHEPMQYIKGELEFLEAKIKVNSQVLIPRPETEILADHICRFLEKQDLKGKCLWDVCTGSGCLAISIKKRFPELIVEASDICEHALQIAKNNAQLNNCTIDFHQGDLFDPFIGRSADFIVSNPPYISEAEYLQLQEEVRLYEPKKALVGGREGIEFYEIISKKFRECLKPSGSLWLELGYSQAEKVFELFNCQGRIEKDWAGHNRFFFLERQ